MFTRKKKVELAISEDLARRIEPHRDRLNLSELATEAITRAVEELERQDAEIQEQKRKREQAERNQEELRTVRQTLDEMTRELEEAIAESEIEDDEAERRRGELAEAENKLREIELVVGRARKSGISGAIQDEESDSMEEEFFGARSSDPLYGAIVRPDKVLEVRVYHRNESFSRQIKRNCHQPAYFVDRFSPVDGIMARKWLALLVARHRSSFEEGRVIFVWPSNDDSIPPGASAGAGPRDPPAPASEPLGKPQLDRSANREGEPGLVTFKQAVRSALPPRTRLHNPGGGVTTVERYAGDDLVYRRGNSHIYVNLEDFYDAYSTFQGSRVSSTDLKQHAPGVFDSQQGGHSCNCTTLFMILGRLGLASEIHGEGVRGAPFYVDIPANLS